MKIRIITIFLAVLSFGLAWPDAARSAVRALFVGNSLTYYNAMPGMVEELGRTSHPRVTIVTEMLVQNGATVRDHLDAGELQRALKTRQYDVVVFQEVGGFPLCASEFPGCSDSPSAIASLIDLIRYYGAKPLWLSTYTSPGDQSELSSVVSQLASRYRIKVADTGAAMMQYSLTQSPIKVLRPNLHPSTIGSWIIAAVVFHALSPKVSMLNGPDVACAPDWTGMAPNLSTFASLQSQPPVHCFALTTAEALSIRNVIFSRPSTFP